MIRNVAMKNDRACVRGTGRRRSKRRGPLDHPSGARPVPTSVVEWRPSRPFLHLEANSLKEA
jgi:hypothetical protein